MSQPSDEVSAKLIVDFNAELRRLADLLKKEFSDNKIVLTSHAKLATALKINQTLPFNLFKTHVQPEFGEKIMSRNTEFIEEIKVRYANEKDSEDLLPTVALIWNQGGKLTRNPKLLQNLILEHLINLCKMGPAQFRSNRNNTGTAGGKCSTTRPRVQMKAKMSARGPAAGRPVVPATPAMTKKSS